MRAALPRATAAALSVATVRHLLQLSVRHRPQAKKMCAVSNACHKHSKLIALAADGISPNLKECVGHSPIRLAIGERVGSFERCSGSVHALYHTVAQMRLFAKRHTSASSEAKHSAGHCGNGCHQFCELTAHSACGRLISVSAYVMSWCG